jgi:hypothetical protein
MQQFPANAAHRSVANVHFINFSFARTRNNGLEMFALISKGFENRSVANVHFFGFQGVSST